MVSIERVNIEKTRESRKKKVFGMGIGDFPSQFFGFCEEFCANFLIESKILSMEAANSFFVPPSNF